MATPRSELALLIEESDSREGERLPHCSLVNIPRPKVVDVGHVPTLFTDGCSCHKIANDAARAEIGYYSLRQ